MTIPEIDAQSGDLTFELVENFNGSLSFPVVLVDDGTLNTPVDVPQSSITTTLTLIVEPVNDAPQLSCNNGSLKEVTEDNPMPDTYSVQDVLLGELCTATDVDSDAIGIAVYYVSEEPTRGTWQYRREGGGDNDLRWQPFSYNIQPDTAVLLPPSAQIRFYPAPDYIGPSGEIAFRAWDMSSSSPNTNENGDTFSFSEGVGSFGVNVKNENDRPILTVESAEIKVPSPGVSVTLSVQTILEIACTEQPNQCGENGLPIIDSDGPITGIVIFSSKLSITNTLRWKHASDSSWTDFDLTTNSRLHLYASSQIVLVTSTGVLQDAEITFKAWDGSNTAPYPMMLPFLIEEDSYSGNQQVFTINILP